MTTALAVFGLGVGVAEAQSSPTVPEPTETVSTRTLDGGSGSTEVSTAGSARGRGVQGASGGAGTQSEAAVLDEVLAQTGSSTGLLVISGVILLVVGGSLVGGRKAYGD